MFCLLFDSCMIENKNNLDIEMFLIFLNKMPFYNFFIDP